jgi:hypothetical protein
VTIQHRISFSFRAHYIIFIGRAQLDQVIDADGHGILKHLGRIADSMAEWEGRISDELKLTRADVASIHTKHPRNLKLQS